jgi:hypothetical protein
VASTYPASGATCTSHGVSRVLALGKGLKFGYSIPLAKVPERVLFLLHTTNSYATVTYCKKAAPGTRVISDDALPEKVLNNPVSRMAMSVMEVCTVPTTTSLVLTAVVAQLIQLTQRHEP